MCEYLGRKWRNYMNQVVNEIASMCQLIPGFEGTKKIEDDTTEWVATITPRFEEQP